ncbi:MAG: thioesterase family protein [Candidatus Bathyarchaeia archaeon]
MQSPTFKTSFRVVWAETDAAGVVHYSNYFRFFERAEEEFYRFLGFSFEDTAKKGLWFPRVEAFCQYKKPARFNDLLEVELTVENLREKSFKLSFKIFNKESTEQLASGHVVVVAADKSTRKATKIPKEIVQKLERFIKQTN